MSSIQTLNSKLIEISDKLNKCGTEEARDSIKKLYPSIREIFQTQFHPQGEKNTIPIQATLILLDILSKDEIQCEDQLKYEIIKICRVLMDLTFITSLKTKRRIYPETQKKMLEIMQKVLYTLPKEEVATKHELKCCWATTLVLNDEKMYVEKFGEEFGLDILKAIITLNPSEALNPLKKVVVDLWHLIKTRWFNEVFSFHLDCKLTLKSMDQSEETFKQKFYPLTKDYDDSKQMAFSVLEGIMEAMEKAIQDGKNALQLTLLKGGKITSEKSEIGIRNFIELKMDKENFWKVRYRALQHLFYLLHYENIQPEIWQACAEAIIDKFKNKTEKKGDNKLLWKLIEDHLENLKKESDNKVFLQGRIKFIKSEIEKLKLKKQDNSEIKGKVKDLKIELVEKKQKKKEQVLKLSQEVSATSVEQGVKEINSSISSNIHSKKKKLKIEPSREKTIQEVSGMSKEEKELMALNTNISSLKIKILDQEENLQYSSLQNALLEF